MGDTRFKAGQSVVVRAKGTKDYILAGAMYFDRKVIDNPQASYFVGKITKVYVDYRLTMLEKEHLYEIVFSGDEQAVFIRESGIMGTINTELDKNPNYLFRQKKGEREW